jgi:ubiquinone/menaquinone biosynthesis C-methylase UbiE
MKGNRKEIQKLLAKYGSLGEIIKKNKISVMADYALSKFVESISNKQYRPRSDDYGLSEAFFQKSIAQFERNVSVIREIRKISEKELSVLDVGAGGKGISLFKTLLEGKNCNFFLFDIKNNFINLDEQAIIGDGCKLPFKDGVFDIVVSVDVVEHVPKSLRHNFYKELKRVCEKKLIITCPLQSTDGVFKGRSYDIAFQCLHELDYGSKELNTQQHIESNHPTLEEINEELPGSVIYGFTNCDVWLKYMIFSSKPFVRLFSGFLYYLFWKKYNQGKPFWGGVITSDFG